VSISKSRGSVVELFDLERVEVLKGPQGTLFGRGAQIGAVHVIQNKAVNKRESSVAIGGGTLNGKNTGAIRASLRWLPTTTSTLDIIANAQTDDSPGTSFKSTRFAPPAGDATPNGLAV
jgi:iron complex outermembrane receptor protein